jgi:hypothetical protein
MKKTSTFVSYAFCLQVLLFLITGVLYWKTRNADDFSGLAVIYTAVPALFLSPVILISSLVIIIKQRRTSLLGWMAFFANIAIGAYFFYFLFYKQ